MKNIFEKIVLTAIFTLLFINIKAQNYNWITPGKTYLKLQIIDNGIYRINKSDFQNAGISTTTIDPRTVKVLYKGNQLPVFFQGEGDGVFDDLDYFDFYGQRNNGGLIDFRDGYSNQILYSQFEYFNEYSDTSAYFVDWGGAVGIRYQNVSSTLNSTLYPQPYFLNKIHGEKDKIFSLGKTTNASSDFKYFSTERVEGEGWFWQQLVDNTSLVDSVYMYNVYSSASPICNAHIRLFPNSIDTHRVQVYMNLQQTQPIIQVLNYQRIDTIVSFPSSLLHDNALNEVNLYYRNKVGPNVFGNIYADCYDVEYSCKFIMYQNKLHVDLSSSSDTTTKLFKISGGNPVNPISIYDAKNNIRITGSSFNSDTLKFSARSNADLYINNSVSDFKKPVFIKQRSVPDLLNISAQYLLVYNKRFEIQAEQLRSHRQTYDTVNALKVETENIYDVFNYGMVHPAAIRNMVRYGYANWSSPKLKYICLLGRASLDPKKNGAQSIYYQNLVPTYGNPPSDGYFGNLYNQNYSYYQNISVGRLPAYNEQEASDIVSKIISYDNNRTNYASWWKKFIFITGGLNASEQNSFKFTSNSLIGNFIYPKPINGDVDSIYRNDSGGGISFSFSDSIKNDINRGALFVNYVGHAGNGTWDNGLENPEELYNLERLPFIFSMTCFTGKNSITEFRGFGERFIYPVNKGAIGFVGNTGWTFSGQGINLNTKFLESFSRGNRRLGDMMRYASISDSLNEFSYPDRFTTNTYNLLGDPMTKVYLPATPEFEIKQSDYSLSNYYPLVNDPITLKLTPHNYGVNADSVKIRFQILKNNISFSIKDTIIRNLGFYNNTVLYNFKLTSNGIYSMKIRIDPDHIYSGDDPSNNEINFNLPIRNLSFVPLKPVDNSLVKTNSVQIEGLNPTVDPTKNIVKVYLQVDTNINFSTPVSFVNTVTSGVYSKFIYNITNPDTSKIYFWRMNSVINNGDSSGWSPYQRFIYRPESVKLMTDYNVRIIKDLQGAFNLGDLLNVSFGMNGIILNNFTGNLKIKSLGNQGAEASEFTFNDNVFRIDGRSYSGLIIIKLNKNTGQFIEFKNVKMNSPQSSDSVLTYLNTFDSTHILMMGKAHTTDGGDSLRPDAKNKIKQFGAQMIDSLKRFDWFDTYSLISFDSSGVKKVSEDYHTFTGLPNGCPDNWCPAYSELHPKFFNTSGSVTSIYGPAFSWKDFSWNQSLQPNSSLKFDVIGIDKNSNQSILFQDLTTKSDVDLSGINAFIYPQLILKGKFSTDSNTGISSPVLKNIILNYTPPAELIPDNFSFQKSDSVVQEGDSIYLKVFYYNLGFVPLNGIVNRWYAFVNGVPKYYRIDTIRTPVQIDSVNLSEIKISTKGLRSANDTISFYFDTYPTGQQNEFYTFNNLAVTQFVVKGDSLKPQLKITYDGKELINGELLPSHPEIIVQYNDDSRINLTPADTSTIKIKLDNQYVPYTLNGSPNPIISFMNVESMRLLATVKFYPSLSEGEHTIEYDIKDISGNTGDTIRNNFSVVSDMKILSLYNYPNPFRTTTDFVFNLSGDKRPDSGTIKIFTAAGRLIKIVELPGLSVGYNKFTWDGRDTDGDEMANGVYFYKMILNGQSKTETNIQKLVILK
ncbi:hypothetical protein BH10BAC5_BH10BAC5_14550 [soil metagenome]